MLSAIPSLLVESFNQRIDLGLSWKADPIVSREELEQYQQEEKIFETVPEWTVRVAPLKELLVIPHDNDEVLESFEDERISPQLAAKNILHWQPHIHFIWNGMWWQICSESKAKIHRNGVFVITWHSAWRKSGVDNEGLSQFLSTMHLVKMSIRIGIFLIISQSLLSKMDAMPFNEACS